MNKKTTKSTVKTPAKSTVNPKINIRNTSAKVTRLLKGIDNDTSAVVKMQDQLNKRITNITQSSSLAKDLVNGLSNAIITAPTPAKPAKTQPAKPAKPAKVPVTKQAKAKPVKQAKVVPVKIKPVKPVKAEKITSDIKSVDNRPQLRQLIIDTVNKQKPITAANIYHVAETVAKLNNFKVWTRQSMYSLLEKLVAQKELTKTGEGPSANYGNSETVVSKATGSDDEEADRLVARVETTSATADVQ